MGKDYQLSSMGNGMAKSPYATEIDSQGRAERDAQTLARLGKKSVLARRFGFLSILGFTCTILITWEGELILFNTGLTNGGSAGLVYGYLFVWAGSIALFATLGELASMAPTSGGQYHWVWMMAPRSMKKFLSYIMGWLVICGWQAVLAGGGYLAGTMIQAVIVLNNPNYTPELWQGTLLFWATVAVALFINTVTGKLLPKIEAFILVLHIVGFFAVLIPLVYMAPNKATPADVFTVFANGGLWPTQGLSVFIGLVGSVFAMFGCDSAVHMAEEVRNADVVVPWAMLTTTLINGALGFGIVIAMLFVTTDITDAIASPTGTLGYPFMQIFVDAVGSVPGATVMVAIVIVMDICGTIAFMATTSRLVWAFARDRGLPGHRFMAKVRPDTAIPLYAVIMTSIIPCLIGLINLGGPTAFNDVISLSVSSLYGSYLITEILLLWCRVTGRIRPRNTLTSINTPELENETNALVWGPFHIPGILGILVNIYAIAFGLIIFFFSFWPTVISPVPSTMNFSVLMTGAVVIFAVLYYVVWARKEYHGPIVEIQPYANTDIGASQQGTKDNTTGFGDSMAIGSGLAM